MSPAQCIVDHLAHFHNTSRISPILTVHPDTKNDVLILKPGRVFCTTHFGVVCCGNAIAPFICPVILAIIDKNARIGKGVRIVNQQGIQEQDGDNWYIRDGIVVVPKNSVVPDGTVI